jgi:hypothetical protein
VEFAVFDTTIRDIGETADEALEKWLPSSDFEQDTSKAVLTIARPAPRGKTLLFLCGSLLSENNEIG